MCRRYTLLLYWVTSLSGLRANISLFRINRKSQPIQKAIFIWCMHQSRSVCIGSLPYIIGIPCGGSWWRNYGLS